MMDDENMVCDDSNRSEDRDSRTLALIGEEALSQLHAARVLVVGVGGVGGYAVEMLARTGVGHLTLIDADCVAPSNLNRQLIALESTIGQPKTGIFASRILDINPDIEIDARPEFLQACAVATLLDEGYDFVLDCIDTVAPKVALIAECLRRNIPLISSMGAGGRTDVSKVTYSDLWETREDGLARAVRQRLKRWDCGEGSPWCAARRLRVRAPSSPTNGRTNAPHMAPRPAYPPRSAYSWPATP